MNLEGFTVDAGTLLVLVFGLVEFAKQLGAQGKGLRALSMGIGVLLAAAFRLREIYPALAVWIDLGFFGLAAGLAASGVFGFLNQRLPAAGDSAQTNPSDPKFRYPGK